MFLNVSLAKDERETLVIPEEALTPEAEKQYVFVVADGKAQRREVRIGGRSPGNVEILAGLEAGERVIVEGTQKVRDGVAVTAIDRIVESMYAGEPDPSTRPAPRPRAFASRRSHDDLRPVGATPRLRDGDVAAAVHPRHRRGHAAVACANFRTSNGRS